MPRSPVALALVLAACGGGGPSADPVDASTDAPWAGRIVVRVDGISGYDTIAPEADRLVVFVAPDGSETVAVTDAAGVAIGPGIPDTTVFVGRVRGPVHVFTAVQPGTVIDVKLPPWFRAVSDLSPGAWTVRLAPAPAGTDDVVAGTCIAKSRAAAPGPVAVDRKNPCPHLHDAMVLGFRTADGVVVGWGARDHVDLTAAPGVVDLPLAAPAPVEVRYTSVPAGVRVQPTVALRGRGFELVLDGAPAPVAGPTVTLDVPTIPIGPAVLRTALVAPPAPDGAPWNDVAHHQPLAGPPVAIDLGDPLAGFANVRREGLSLRWDWTGNTAHTGDLVRARLTFRSVDGRDQIAHLYGPGDRDAIVVPPWPGALANAAPLASIQAHPPVLYDPLDRAGYAAALRDAYFDRLADAPGGADPPYPDERLWTTSHASTPLPGAP